MTKSSKKSKRTYSRPVMQRISTARPTPSPTPPPTNYHLVPTPPPTELNDDDDDDDDDDAVNEGAVTFPPGEVRFPHDDGAKYGIGVHETELSQGAPQSTPVPTQYPNLKPLEKIDEFTRLVTDSNAKIATILPTTQSITESPTAVTPDHDTTLSPTVYLFRHRNHQAGFQSQNLIRGRNFDGPMGTETIAVEENVVDSSKYMSSEADLSSLFLLGDAANGNSAGTSSNLEVSLGLSSKPNCRSSLCSTRTRANQNHYCCNPSECRQEDVIYPLPSFRYGNWKTTVYTNLTMLYFADVFGYTESTWELRGTNPVEQRSFLHVPDQELLMYMGVSSFQYDCWFNHYQSYSWDELECYGLADAYQTLGWDADTWGTIHSSTWSFREEIDWNELTSNERKAARKLCYFQELWNGETLSDWRQDWMKDVIDSHDVPEHTDQTTAEYDEDSPAAVPSDTPTASSPAPSASTSDDPTSGPTMPSLNPTKREVPSMAPSISDSGTPSTIPTVNPSTLPSVMRSISPSEQSSEGPSISLSSSPSLATASSCLSSACSNRTTENVGHFCCGTDTCNRKSIVLPIPTFRWKSWDKLKDSVRATARELGYTKDLWNHPGAYELERWSFGFLSPPNQQHIIELGFTPQTWDCWQNHYQDYSWEELSCFGLKWAAEALGWTGTSWSKNGPLVQDRKDWSSLSYKERIAARELCYLPALWEHTPLDEWDG